MSEDSIRTRRVAELLKQQIAAILANEINDPRVHDVVITRVKVTKDLSLARVYYSTYDKKAHRDIQIGLEKSQGFIQRKLVSSVHLKKVPRIAFERDETPEGAERLDELFRQLNAGENRENQSEN